MKKKRKIPELEQLVKDKIINSYEYKETDDEEFQHKIIITFSSGHKLGIQGIPEHSDEYTYLEFS